MDLSDYKEIIAIAILLAPLAAAAIRYIWNLGSVQAKVKDADSSYVIEMVVDKAIHAIEQVAKKSELSSEEKKSKALEMAKSIAVKFGVPKSLIDDELFSGYIESALEKVDW